MVDTSSKNRKENIHLLTRRLMILTGSALAGFTAIFAITFFLEVKLLITLVVFVCGIIGGFVSIQQRLPKIDDEELALISESWFQILLVPIFGAVFALVLYCLFLSGLLKGDIFPDFAFPKPLNGVPDTNFIVAVLRETYPSSGPSLAKLIFWSFAAGFAERLVPQIISNITSKSG